MEFDPAKTVDQLYFSSKPARHGRKNPHEKSVSGIKCIAHSLFRIRMLFCLKYTCLNFFLLLINILKEGSLFTLLVARRILSGSH
jgi:hypothetical protein